MDSDSTRQISRMDREEAERILRQVKYWHYPFKLPWETTNPDKPGHDTRHLARWRYFFPPLLKECGGSLAGKSILDLGCCQGFWSFESARHGAQYCLGLDSSPTFIREAQALNIIYEFPQVKFATGNLEESQIWEDLDSFHVTLTLGLIYHLAAPFFVLRKAMQATSEIMLIDTDINPSDDPILQIVPRDPAEPTTRESIHTGIRTVPSKSALRILLEEGGFSDVQFLQPHDDTPWEYHHNRRIGVLAIR
jgi:2-polyprenyl-3-methyl-5-hydroxy-6-metoxy-1,4-benzoquinol methylase